MKDLVDTTEMYLRTIYELEEEGIIPLRARIAERLEQSGPTVSQTVARMARDGLVIVRPDRSLEMTEEGRQLATAVMRKHRLAERLLTDILGLDIHQVHDEACRWEHVMSDEVEKRMVAVLNDATRSPFGNPIPGLADLGLELDDTPDAGVRAVDLPNGERLRAKIVQVNEILQVDVPQFTALQQAGIVIGADVDIINDHGRVRITREGQEVELIDDLCHAVRVELI